MTGGILIAPNVGKLVVVRKVATGEMAGEPDFPLGKRSGVSDSAGEELPRNVIARQGDVRCGNHKSREGKGEYVA